MGVLMMMEEDEPELFKNQMTQMLKISTDNLEEAITDLNDVLSIRARSKLKLERVNVKEAVLKVVAENTGYAQENGVSIYVDVEPEIEVDAVPEYLESILECLISNSIKYSSPERDSNVFIKAADYNDEIKITVEDNGIGIDLEQHGSTLFGMYKKFHDDDSKGLGLYITKNHIEAMGGRIKVNSRVNVGTKITVFMPVELRQNE